MISKYKHEPYFPVLNTAPELAQELSRAHRGLTVGVPWQLLNHLHILIVRPQQRRLCVTEDLLADALSNLRPLGGGPAR